MFIIPIRVTRSASYFLAVLFSSQKRQKDGKYRSLRKRWNMILHKHTQIEIIIITRIVNWYFDWTKSLFLEDETETILSIFRRTINNK